MNEQDTDKLAVVLAKAFDRVIWKAATLTCLGTALGVFLGRLLSCAF